MWAERLLAIVRRSYQAGITCPRSTTPWNCASSCTTIWSSWRLSIHTCRTYCRTPNTANCQRPPKPKELPRGLAFVYLGGGPVSDDLKMVLTMWCAKQRREIQPGWIKPCGRGRPGAWEKEKAICLAYARKLEETPQQKKESVIAELAQEYGLKRRRVFDIIKDTDPDLLLRAIRDPDPFGWGSDQSLF